MQRLAAVAEPPRHHAARGPLLDLQPVAPVNADVAVDGLGLEVCVRAVGDRGLDAAVDDRELLAAVAIRPVEDDARAAVDELATDAARHAAELKVALADVDDDATFSLRGVGGNVTVTGTDGDRAELKITKHGGSPQERSAARVLLSKTNDHLSLVSAAPPGAVEISYEIKLPRELHQIEITSDKGGVKVEEFGGAVVVNLREGNLEFRDVTGSVHSKLVNGDTKVSLDTNDREGEQEFSVVNGDIEATIADGADADLKAETVTGDISVDDRYGLKVERRPVGHSVAGQLGDGGPPLQLKVVRGDIKLKK